MDTAPNPPAYATGLIRRFLPAGNRRECLLGDLHELYLDRLDSGGARRASAWRRWKADLWYWGQVLGLVLRHVAGVFTRRRDVELGLDERTRMRGRGTMLGGWKSVQLAFRGLVRQPSFSIPAIVILAVGMASGMTTFTLADSILFRPLDYPDSRRIVLVCEEHTRTSGFCIASPGNVHDLGEGSSTVSVMGFGRGWGFMIQDDQGGTGVRGGLATAGFMEALGVEPMLGRGFSPDEVGPDNDKVLLLSHEFWVQRYGGDRDVVGRTLSMDGSPHTVVGVLPAGFEAPLNLGGIEIWKPPHVDPQDPDVRGWRGFRGIGRLAPGASLAAADAELSAAYRALGDQYEEIDDEWRLRVRPLIDVVVGDTRGVLFAFLGASAVLLLIVCANVANLVLARGLERGKERSVRAALGADRRRLIGEQFVEGSVLALLGLAIALPLTHLVLALVVRFGPQDLPRLEGVALDAGSVLVSGVLALLVTVLFSGLPALRLSSMAESLRVRGGSRSRRVQNLLVGVEVALCLTLVSGAGVLVRSFTKYLEWDPGYEVEQLVAVSAFVDMTKYGDREGLLGFYRDVETRLLGIPGVEASASASAGPLFGGGDGGTPFVVPGSSEPGTGQSVWWFDIGPGFFDAMGLPMVAGREFEESDGSDGAPVAVVNEAFQRMAFPDGEPLGRVVRLPDLDASLEIVGVVADVPPVTPGASPRPEIYWPNRQRVRPATFFLVRSGLEAGSLVRLVEGAVEEVDPSASVGTARPLTETLSRTLVRPRFQSAVLTTLALVALLLSAVGVYAVLAYSVTVRGQELGIRRALGASVTSLMLLVAKSSALVVFGGIAVGLIGAVFSGRLLQGMAHGVSPSDPLVLGMAVIIVGAAGAIATVIPARRSVREDLRDTLSGSS